MAVGVQGRDGIKVFLETKQINLSKTSHVGQLHKEVDIVYSVSVHSALPQLNLTLTQTVGG